MVPAGQTVLVVMAVSSDEYPYYTDPETTSDFNDLLTWDIQPSVGDAIVGDIDVNSLHTDWEIAELLGETLPGLPGLVHYEKFKAFTAPPEAALTIDVEISATNIGDGSLPSHMAVGVLPIELVIPKVDQNGQEIPGQLVSADELNVSKMEQSLTVEKSGGAVSKLELDVANDIDRFRIRILGGAGIAEAKQVTAMVKTAGNADAKYDDPDTEIELNADGGDLITKSLMLVSDDIDDAFSGPVDVGAEEQEGDRTHVIQLGGKLTVSKLLFDIDECELDARRPIHAKKQVTLNFVILDDGNVDVQEMRGCP